MKNLMAKLGMIACCCILFVACEPTNSNYPQEANQADYIHRSMKQLTDVIVEDIFSPPVASRIYVYPSVAAYEIMLHDNAEYQSLVGQLRGLKNVPQPEAGAEYCFPLAAVHAFCETGKALVFSENKMEEFAAEMSKEFAAMKIPQAVFDRSIAYGKSVSEHMLSWADTDNYKETRTFPKYTIPNDPGKWKPTPPDYMDGIEPAWREIRLMVLDSAGQFAPPPPTPFDTKKGSKFMEETMEVYQVVKEVKAEEKAIAQFWDCNPFVSHHKGHVMFATKKITPGGHWVNIASLAAQKTNADLMKSVETYALVSLSLFEGFISCWDEKYRSNLVRPESVINTFVDAEWLPILQTPPFPEHTSGHSVVSGASSVTLTNLYGENFAYEDNTEVEYGLPVRSFNSFKEAAEEAAISRLYGGIHYRPAIDLGVTQGRSIAQLIAQRVKTKR